VTDSDRTNLAIWRLAENAAPQQYVPATLAYEKDLEDWIASDPTLVDSDLLLIGRQIKLNTGILDVLALNRQGQWAVVEIKRSSVRRETVAQALDYAGAVASFTSQELKELAQTCLEKRGLNLPAFLKKNRLSNSIFTQPEILVYVVGTQRDINLDRISKHTTFHGHLIHVVLFDVYRNSDGEHILLRHLSGAEMDMDAPVPPAPSRKASRTPLPDAPSGQLRVLQQMADANGIGDEFRKVYIAATTFGLYPNFDQESISYTPQQGNDRVLLCTWAKPQYGGFRILINTSAFSEIFQISQQKAIRIAGVNDFYTLTAEQTDNFIITLKKLFDAISHKAE
jgi:hypothetical protein